MMTIPSYAAPYERNAIYVGETRANSETDLPNGVSISFAAGSRGNTVRLAPDGQYQNVKISLNSASFCTVAIGKIRINFGSITISFVSNKRWSSGASVSIGDGTTFNGNTQIIGALTPGVDVSIGKDCLFSTGISIRGSSHHGLWDLDTGELLNPESGITIGDRVWIGDGTVVLNKAAIPTGSVVGARSLVNKAFAEPNTLIAGTPATVRRRRVEWTTEFPVDNGATARAT